MDADPTDSLTAAEKEVLRLFLVMSDVKAIARQLERSVPTIEQRLTRARRKLGVTRSLDAALILARAEAGPTYGPSIYAPSTPSASPPPEGTTETSEAGDLDQPWLPLPTPGRPWNDLPLWTRLVWIVVGALAFGIGAVAIVNMGETASRLVRKPPKERPHAASSPANGNPAPRGTARDRTLARP